MEITLSNIIHFPSGNQGPNGNPKTIIGRLVIAEPLRRGMQLDALECAYLVGYMDAANGLESALPALREYDELMQRIFGN